MAYDTDKADDAALALLYLNTFQDGPLVRAWKGLPLEITDRLHEKGLIHNPVGKAKSLVLTEEGQKRSAELFAALFEPKE